MYTAGSFKDALWWRVKVSWPIFLWVIFSAIPTASTLNSFFAASLISCGYLIARIAAVIIARPTSLVTMSTLSNMFGWSCSFIVIHIFSIRESVCYFHQFWHRFGGWFFPILQWGPNGEALMRRHLLLARRRRFNWIYERNASPLFCVQDFTSSIDVGCFYVERKLLVNWFSISPQLPMESSGSLLNQDRVAPVRCSYKLCIAIALEPPKYFDGLKIIW
jgi:hypothetical protein